MWPKGRAVDRGEDRAVGCGPCPLLGGGMVFMHPSLDTVLSFIFLRLLKMVLDGESGCRQQD